MMNHVVSRLGCGLALLAGGLLLPAGARGEEPGEAVAVKPMQVQTREEPAWVQQVRNEPARVPGTPAVLWRVRQAEAQPEGIRFLVGRTEDPTFRNCGPRSNSWPRRPRRPAPGWSRRWPRPSSGSARRRPAKRPPGRKSWPAKRPKRPRRRGRRGRPPHRGDGSGGDARRVEGTPEEARGGAARQEKRVILLGDGEKGGLRVFPKEGVRVIGGKGGMQFQIEGLKLEMNAPAEKAPADKKAAELEKRLDGLLKELESLKRS